MIFKKIKTPKKAYANVKGNAMYPKIYGKVEFVQKLDGVLVTAEIFGLPYESECNSGVFAFHIHSGNSCSGNDTDPFADAVGHYNPNNCNHPYHAGDLPPLFGNHGYAYMSVLTDRFNVKDIIDRVIIIHSKPDDFTSQPSGNAGEKIACGKIIVD